MELLISIISVKLANLDRGYISLIKLWSMLRGTITRMKDSQFGKIDNKIQTS